MEREQTCAERIGEHLDGRLTDFRAIAELQDHDSILRFDDVPDGLSSGETGLSRRALDMAREQAGEEYGRDPASIADDILDAYPLGVSRKAVFRVELSTGGPADWLEVICGNTVADPYGARGGLEVEEIVYHFADWFDHAERELSGEEFDAAERFVCSVVPELVA